MNQSGKTGMPAGPGRVVILGTGGTIAGLRDDPGRAWHYQAAQLSVDALVQAVPALQSHVLSAQQVAQVDSKDMGWAIWRELARALQTHLAEPDVSGVVITHGTDTLEETAYLLHRLHDGRKPVVLTGAMRPADAPDADGPANLLDAVRVVEEAARRGLGGVAAVMAGRVWAGRDVRKAHSREIDAFDGGGARPLAVLAADGGWRDAMPVWPVGGQGGWAVLQAVPPRVELVFSHADADGWLVDAALAHARALEPGRAGQSGQGMPDRPLRGLVVAGTGHGTVHQGLSEALVRAKAAGVKVWRTTRVARGGVLAREGDALAASGPLTPAQARIALILALLGVPPDTDATPLG